GRLGAHRRGVDAPLRMGDGARTNRRLRDLEELPVPLEDVLAERPDHDLRGFHEAGARFLHRDPEAGILHARRSPSAPKTAWLTPRPTVCAVSTKRARASSIGIRKPAYSTLAAPRPNPRRHRPPDRMSSSAMSYALRARAVHGNN